MDTIALIMEKKSTIIRMDEGLYERLKRAADRTGRSLNSFIVEALEKSVSAEIPKLRLEDYVPNSQIKELGAVLRGSSSLAGYADYDWKELKLKYLKAKYEDK